MRWLIAVNYTAYELVSFEFQCIIIISQGNACLLNWLRINKNITSKLGKTVYVDCSIRYCLICSKHIWTVMLLQCSQPLYYCTLIYMFEMYDKSYYCIGLCLDYKILSIYTYIIALSYHTIPACFTMSNISFSIVRNIRWPQC